MKLIPYASAMGSLMYLMLCTSLDIFFAMGMVSRYQFNLGPKHWTTVKHILKYLRRMKECVFMLQSVEII